jgi:DNA-binding beta-propeller fold protein YncE
MRRFSLVGVFTLMLLSLFVLAMRQNATTKMGKQLDGSFVVSSGRSILPGTIAFAGRPVDIAVHPIQTNMFAVTCEDRVFLANNAGALPYELNLGDGVAHHGIVWNRSGSILYVSISGGHVQEVLWDGAKLSLGRKFIPKPASAKDNARPGGLVLTKDDSRLFVASMDRNSITEMDTKTGELVKEFPVQNLPYDVKLSSDETQLIVSNWGGSLVARSQKEKEEKREKVVVPGHINGKASENETSESVGALLLVDRRGIPVSGTVSIVNRSTGATRHLEIGIHPTGISVVNNKAYIACAASDHVAEVDIPLGKLLAKRKLQWGKLNLFGAMPNAIVCSPDGKTLSVACGGDNAIAQMDRASGKVFGYFPVGYYPTALAFGSDQRLLVVNTKGNGSVRNTMKGKPGNAHDFQGTVSVVDTNANLGIATAQVVRLNGWNRDPAKETPNLKVFNGAIKHVLYIIKENRTYDEIFGDMKQGDGDVKLCGLGEVVTPNHHQLAREFTLFDNGYVSGTNSADGHNWTDSALANDYLEHEYTGYRTYPDCGEDPMGLTQSGYIWDAALKHKKSVRIYGEFCDENKNKVIPQPKDWAEVYAARGTDKFRFVAVSNVASVKPLICPNYLYWPLTQSDQSRADIFIKEYTQFSQKNQVPNLMVLSLPSDHTEGMSSEYPTPKSMVADNDLALGRIVDAVSKSKEWKETAIFVIEDDAQAGPDHIDGHRTVFACYSPYVRRGMVDSNFYTTVTMLRTIEKMLGLSPMNRMDALTPPMSACFTDTPDVTPYTSVPNRTPIGEMNPKRSALNKTGQHWYDVSESLDWSGIDKADFGKLNKVVWHSLHGEKAYPGE